MLAIRPSTTARSTALAALCRAELRRLDDRDTPADWLGVAGAGAHELTPREVEVLGLIAAGWSNQEIANALFISR
jgi:DNA-binding NarL/FixJ family response regulator